MRTTVVQLALKLQNYVAEIATRVRSPPITKRGDLMQPSCEHTFSMSQPLKTSPRSAIVAILGLLALAGSALAGPSVIVTNGNWNATGTWSTAAVPANSSGVGIGNNSTVTFQSGDSYTGGGWTQGLLIGYNSTYGGYWSLGNPGTGTLNVTGGTLTNGYLAIGGGAVGTMNISGGNVTADQTMLLGWDGAGSSINVSGGSFTLSAGADTANIGHGGSATFTVSGGTATFNRVFGFLNNSTLTISGTGTMTTTVDHIYTSGTVNVNGGTLNDAGYFTGANLNVAGGTINLNRAGGSHLGLNSTQTNTVSSGQLNSSVDLYLGQGGNATVNQSGGNFSVAAGKIFYLGSGGGTGTYNQTGGTLEVGNMVSGGGTATYNLRGGTLKALGNLNYTTAGITTSISGTNGGATIDANGNTVTLNAAQINLGASGSLTKAGAGSLVINNDAGFSTGTWNVNAGSLNMVGYFNGAAVNVAGGTLNLNRAGGSHFSLTSTSTNTLSSGAISNTGDLYLGYSAGGNGTLNQSGGTLTVTGDFSVGGNGGAGTWNISGGSQSITGALAVNANSAININTNGTLTKAATIQSGGVVNINGGSLTAAPTIASGGQLNINSGGTLSNTPTFQGGGLVSLNSGGALTTAENFTIGAGGTLKFNGGTASINGGTGYLFNNGTLDVNGQTVAAGSYEAAQMASTGSKLANSSSTAATIVGTGNKNTVWINAAGAVIETVGNLTIGSIVTDGDATYGFTKTGAGTLVLTHAGNDYAGETRLAAGGLSIGSATALQNSTLNLDAADAGTVTAIGQNSTLGGLSGSRNLNMFTRTLSIGNNNASTTYSGQLSNGALTKIGTGTLTLTGSNSYTGSTTLNGGTLRVQHLGALGSGAITQSSGASTLVIDTTGTLTNTMSIYNIATLQTVTLSGAKTLNNATYDIAANTTTTESGALSGTGGVNKIGAGTLVLAGSTNNTYTGATVVGAGSLVLSNSSGNAINNSSSITVDSGASLILRASNQIGNGIGLVLNGGTFIVGTSTAGYSETLGTLTLNASSTIDLGAATNVRFLQFANSASITWATNAVLTITNWQGQYLQSSDVAEVLFGTSGLTATQLGQIYFANQNISGGVLIGGNGELVPIPEANVIWGAAAIALAVGWRERRRLALIVRRLRGKRDC
ncbi:MAG: hypothetical protein FGM15_12075 [Chthoniobacterales bacterium]|nr:hypothetical protein [Chthoniobacterales bacterium]